MNKTPMEELIEEYKEMAEKIEGRVARLTAQRDEAVDHRLKLEDEKELLVGALQSECSTQKYEPGSICSAYCDNTCNIHNALETVGVKI